MAPSVKNGPCEDPGLQQTAGLPGIKPAKEQGDTGVRGCAVNSGSCPQSTDESPTGIADSLLMFPIHFTTFQLCPVRLQIGFDLT